MANHPYGIGDEVLIRGNVIDVTGSWITVEPATDEDSAFEIHAAAITQSTPTEPPDKSVLLDRYGYSWQRVNGMWSQGDVNHGWSYLLEHNGPIEVIHRPTDNRGGTSE